MKKNRMLLFLSLAFCCCGELKTKTPGFVKKSPLAVEKNIEKKIIELAKEVFDLAGSVTISLAVWSKCVSDTVFQLLDNGNKEQMGLLLQDLKKCKQELLEIQKKIDTLQN